VGRGLSGVERGGEGVSDNWFVLRHDGSCAAGPLSKEAARARAQQLYETDDGLWRARKRTAPRGYSIAEFTAWSVARLAEVDALRRDLLGCPVVSEPSNNPNAITLPIVVSMLVQRTGLRGWVARLVGTSLEIDPPQEPRS
jgi:hypothetical protein